jgi:hypothetical protein
MKPGTRKQAIFPRNPKIARQNHLIFPLAPRLNQRGQEGAGYRLIIEAVLALFILVIIIGVVSQIDEWRWQVSVRRLYEGFDKALNSPDGSVIVEKDLILKSGSSYSSRAFEGRSAGIEADCIEIDASESMAYSLQENRIVQVNSLIQTNVYYKCLPGKVVGENCETFCTVSFGKELEAESS